MADLGNRGAARDKPETPGRKTDWQKSLLRNLVEAAANVYRIMPDHSEEDVCKLVFDVLTKSAGPDVQFPSEKALLRRLQQAKKEIAGTTFKLAVAKNMGHARRRDLVKECEKLGVKVVYDKTTAWLSQGEGRRSVNMQSIWTNDAIEGVRKLRTRTNTWPD